MKANNSQSIAITATLFLLLKMNFVITSQGYNTRQTQNYINHVSGSGNLAVGNFGTVVQESNGFKCTFQNEDGSQGYDASWEKKFNENMRELGEKMRQLDYQKNNSDEEFSQTTGGNRIENETIIGNVEQGNTARVIQGDNNTVSLN